MPTRARYVDLVPNSTAGIVLNIGLTLIDIIYCIYCNALYCSVIGPCCRSQELGNKLPFLATSFTVNICSQLTCEYAHTARNIHSTSTFHVKKVCHPQKRLTITRRECRRCNNHRTQQITLCHMKSYVDLYQELP